jgi:hypothetical protein
MDERLLLMFHIASHDGRGNGGFFDLEDLPLADGRMAHTLSREELYRELEKLDVAGIDPCAGKQCLLVSYAKYLREQG